MAILNQPFVSFTGGEIGPSVMSRVQMEGYGATAALMQNVLCWTEGNMSLRPGFGMKCEVPGDAWSFLLPFVFDVSETYLAVLQAGVLYIARDGELISRPSTTASIAGGSFPNLSGWTDISESGGSASASGALSLTSNGTAIAGVRQQCTNAHAGVQTALNLHVLNGPIRFQVGSASGWDDYIAVTDLQTGYHSLMLTPASTQFWIQITSTLHRAVVLDSIAVASAGLMSLTTPWSAQVTIRALKYQQSGNVLYVSSGLGPTQRIERRGDGSWSIVNTGEENGPFLGLNTDPAISLTPSVIVGNGSLTSSKQLFHAEHVGALFQIAQSGQSVTGALTGDGQNTDYIKVTGTAGITKTKTSSGFLGTGLWADHTSTTTGNSRTITFSISGTFSATISLQQSVGSPYQWTTVATYSTEQGLTAYDDGRDNQTVYYRLAVESGNYVSGTANVTLNFSGGITSGVVRITGFNNPVSASMEVLQPLANTSETNQWAEGAWSDRQGWPKATAIFDGRLFSVYSDRFAGSQSDSYESYALGDMDSNAIIQPIGTGAANPGVWVAGLQRLLIGTQGSEASVKASALDTPLTPMNISVKTTGTYGQADIQPVVVDQNAISVEKSGFKVMEHVMSNSPPYDYRSISLMRLHRNLGRPGIIQLAVARQPDTRLFALRSDGVLLPKLYAPDENALGWSRIVTQGVIESAAVLPCYGAEDKVYAMVARTINGGTKRFLECLDPIYIATAADANNMDCYTRLSISGADAVTGADYLEGETVQVWINGARHPDRVVSGGGFDLDGTYTGYVTYGLGYTGRYRSSKLAYGSHLGTALSQKARPVSVSFILQDAFTAGIEYGCDFTMMDVLPASNPLLPPDEDTGLITGVTESYPVPGNQKTRDPRFCVQLSSPYPVTIQGFVLGHEIAEEV